ncbi:sigma-70 family RNA polymerase sigma factor [Anabaena sp. FACHB-1237]|uniref:sigma-70 family RNA polymerase sigma factor n=1 Tax=Anabaena sp. FACHB-1237 TaxID=2692769 RepID=UPI00167FE753|nr:sigma-70 family RNA polymerase sigma factor [Anabaena sp. FACHB-1237]MBD2136150.1 sigma-70 family RNA polymerase sigma factor [Anabaena sp. FACHB-1237]
MTTITSNANELKQQITQLLKQYEQSRSERVRNQLVELNFGLVRKEALYWMNQCHESYDDLLQVGSIGLIKAIEKFELSKGHALSSYAVPYIRGEIQHYLRDNCVTVPIPRHWVTIQQKSVLLTHCFQEKYNRQPTDVELAAGLKISVDEWQKIKLAWINRNPLSLDVTIKNHEQESTCLNELVPDHNYRSFQLAQEDQLLLQQALMQLEERTRQILEYVFLHDLTQKEVAEQLGISIVTVSRRIKKGLYALKNFIFAAN